MFEQKNVVLTANLVTSGTLNLGPLSRTRLVAEDHLILTGSTQYNAPGDFTVGIDGSGNGILTWLHATTIVSGATMAVFLAYYDAIVKTPPAEAPAGVATESTLAAMRTAIDAINGKVDLLVADVDQSRIHLAAIDVNIDEIHDNVADVVVTPTAAQDPIFDHAAGVKPTIGAATSTLITTGAATRFLHVSSDNDVLLNTNAGNSTSTAVADTGDAILIKGGAGADIIPVPPNTIVRAIRGGASDAVVRVTPMKVR